MDVAAEKYRAELKAKFGRVRVERPEPRDYAHRMAVVTGNNELLAPKKAEDAPAPEHTQNFGKLFKAMGTSFPVLTK